MANEWYFGWDDRRFGPFSEEQLMELAERGRIKPTDIIWREGIDKGILAEKVRNLFRSPRVESNPVVVSEPVAIAPSVLERPAVGNSRSVPATSEKYNEWLATNNDLKAEGILHEVPDGLMLRGIPGQND